MNIEEKITFKRKKENYMSSFLCSQKRLKYELIPRMRRKLQKDRGVTYRIAALAFTKNGNFIDIRYNNHRDFLSDGPGAGLHAEQDLIHRYGNRIDTIYILRVGNSGKVRPIHPCKTCAKIAAKRGIKIIPLHEEFNLITDGYVYTNGRN